MNPIMRALAVSLSLSLILSAPGLLPYQAIAQTLGAVRIAAPSGQSGAVGAVVNGLGGSAIALPSASFQANLVPTLSPSAALTPVLSAPAAISAASPVSALPPRALTAAQPAAATPEKAVAPASALGVLQTGTNALGAATKNASAEAPRVALDGLFEGSIARPDSLAVAGLSAPSDSPRLAASGSRAPQGPRWVKTLRAPGDSPATSVKRTLSVGFLAAVIPLAITMGAVVIAQMLGYQLHPNYQGPSAGDVPTILSALAMWVGAAVMAPVSEEAIFRGGLQGGLAKLSAKLHLGSFILPAVITSLIFVALHETSDPLLFATRFVHAMILSHVYHKEGILASMAAHGFFNGLLAMSVVFSALGMPWLGLATVPVVLFFAMRAAKTIRAQKPDIDSGALAPKPLSAALSFAFAGILALGYFLLMPNIFWA
ncbi:MAG: hypothetical protein COV48_12860, partial [Elusimicrobia bacterium CG11_big_fil_rev_8_21_14_0_20_64_6]